MKHATKMRRSDASIQIAVWNMRRLTIVSLLILFLAGLGFLLLMHAGSAQALTVSATIRIHPNGGIYEGSKAVTDRGHYWGSYSNLECSVSLPQRSGYRFAGWVLESGTAVIKSFGSLFYSDGFFENATTTAEIPGFFIYDQLEGTNVSAELVAADSVLGQQKNMLKIKNTGKTAPSLGGFCFSVDGYPSAIIYQVILAKIPIGYRLRAASNYIGDFGQNAVQECITNDLGTGDWQVYIIKRVCAPSGSIENTGYLYLEGAYGTPQNPVEWFVAYHGIYDGTEINALGNIQTMTVQLQPGSTSTLRALWIERDTWISYAEEPNGSGTQADPFLIETPAHLAYFATSQAPKIDVHLQLNQNIDLQAHEWEPISGNNATYVLEGNGFTIANMCILNTQQSDIGLFGAVFGLTVRDVRFTNVRLNGFSQIGSVVGYCEWTHIDRCSVTGVLSGGSSIGAIAGFADNISSTGCHAEANILARENLVGGLFGSAAEGTVADAYFSGTVTGQRQIGGIVGVGENVDILRAYADCTLQGDSNIGGICYKGQDIRDSGFRGIIRVQGVNLGTIAALQSISVKDGVPGGSGINCFAVCEVQLVHTSTTGLCTSGFSSKTTILDCYVEYNISFAETINGNLIFGQHSIKQFTLNPDTCFQDWTANAQVNTGLPVPKALFPAMVTTSTVDCLKLLYERGFQAG